MTPAALHEQLDDRLPAVFSLDVGPLAEVESHVATGCSRCARALVNAREAAVVLAESTVPMFAIHPGDRPRAVPDQPSPNVGSALRERILARARPALAGRVSQGTQPRRFFDPAGEVARLHLGGAGDAERIREIDELGVADPAADDLCGRLLAQLQRLVGFPLLFVSVVRGERTGFRVQRGLDALQGTELTSAPRDRRRVTSFCTHTVSFDAPLLVPDAAAEPFFRGSVMVMRDGIRAYVGVPLRTSRGVVVGTVCAMDYVPRRLGPEVVRVLQLFAEAVAAEIERARLPPERRWPRTSAGAPIHPEPWFRALLASPPTPRPGPGACLLVVAPEHTEALADRAHADEPVGRIAGGRAALLLNDDLAERRMELSRGLSVEHLAVGSASFGNYLR
jgi:hypothetical protein